MALYDPNSWLGQIIEGMTTGITGDLFLTFLILFIVLAVMMLALWKLDFQLVALSLTGIILTMLAYSGEWLVFGGILFMILAILVARYFTGDN